MSLPGIEFNDADSAEPADPTLLYSPLRLIMQESHNFGICEFVQKRLVSGFVLAIKVIILGDMTLAHSVVVLLQLGIHQRLMYSKYHNYASSSPTEQFIRSDLTAWIIYTM